MPKVSEVISAQSQVPESRNSLPGGSSSSGAYADTILVAKRRKWSQLVNIKVGYGQGYGVNELD